MSLEGNNSGDNERQKSESGMRGTGDEKLKLLQQGKHVNRACCIFD